MYNIFKRPMFKLGGMTQGTGIMSHVEPRPKYFSGGRIMAQEGYNPFTYFAPTNIPKAGIPRIMETKDIGFTPFSRMQEKFKSLPTYVPFKETIDLDNLLIEQGLLSKNAPITERLAAREKYKKNLI